MAPTPTGTPATYFLSTWLFRRLLGLVYLAAFVSLWLQVDGLIGSRGIVPVKQTVSAARDELGPQAYRRLPTLCWFASSDTSLQFLCGAGAGFAVLLVLGIAPLPALLGLWVLYLSLVTAGDIFLAYQWDNLLLEAGLLAVFLAPPHLLDRLPGPSGKLPAAPPKLPLWLMRWLLFRLMFCAGVVKLSSGDPTWWDLTALTYHYQTQPLPSWTSWHVHHLPLAVHRLSAAGTFAIELLLPCTIVMPRRIRLAGAAGFLILQLLIALTGNYGFFNLLSAGLCLVLIDDAAFGNRWCERLSRATPAPTPRRRYANLAAAPLAALVLLITSVQMIPTFGGTLGQPNTAIKKLIVTVFDFAAPFRSINRYGLFAVMTTTRSEILIQGSDDGVSWKTYHFQYKPGDPARRPRFAGLHMPRLDWQMWFAALSRAPRPWFYNFAQRLLQGSQPVLALLEDNPFPSAPPRYLRAILYDYRFTSPDKPTARWWRRERLRPYCPILTLDPQGGLQAVEN